MSTLLGGKERIKSEVKREGQGRKRRRRRVVSHTKIQTNENPFNREWIKYTKIAITIFTYMDLDFGNFFQTFGNFYWKFEKKFEKFEKFEKKFENLQTLEIFFFKLFTLRKEVLIK